MKRLIILFCLLSLLLTGCSLSRKGITMSPACQVSAMEVLKTTDRYLDGEMTAVIAAGQIRDLCLALSIMPSEPGAQNQLVANYCEILSHNIMEIAEGEQTDIKELLNARNNLADLLGQNKRSK